MKNINFDFETKIFYFKSIFEIFLILFNINIFFNLNIINNKFGFYLYPFIILWLLLSYFLERYDDLVKKKNYNKKYLINNLKYLFIFNIFNILLIYLNQFNFSLLLIPLVILIESEFVLLNALRFFKKNIQKNWIFYSKDDHDLKEINDFISINPRTSYHHIIYVNEISKKQINKIFNNFKISGIIFANNSDYINVKDNFKKIDSYSINIWTEKFLKLIIPDKIATDKDFICQENLNVIIKMAFDIVISSTLLLFCVPIIFIASIFIFFEDRLPIFYKQIRSGKNNDVFTIWKLRSMKKNSEKEGVKWAETNDNRITKTGAFLRKMRIDELPQLLQVLNGNLSLIGPRPERPEFDIQLRKVINKYNLRYSIKPGISGWAQVNYPYGSSFYDTKNKLAYDLFYIKNNSIFLDIVIFFKTIKLVLNAKGAVPIQKKT